MRDTAARDPVIDAATQLCISLAERPGRMGMALHNAGYRALGLNFIYKAFAVSDLAGAIQGVRAFGIRGVSVSMPFKEAVIGHLDACEPKARAVGAINTVVNDAGILTGYNTDVEGAARALGDLGPLAGRAVLVLAALRDEAPAALRLAARNGVRAASVAREWDLQVVDWEERERVPADLVINATPVGMTPNHSECPFDVRALPEASAVMDLVVSPFETRLIREARARGLFAIPGHRMAMHQAAAQFHLYTGHAAPLDIFELTLRELLTSPQ